MPFLVFLGAAGEGGGDAGRYSFRLAAEELVVDEEEDREWPDEEG